jgi:hypothetical protein
MIDGEFPGPLQTVQVETERRHILRQILHGLLEGDEHTGFAELGGAPHQELDAEQGFAATRAAAHQCRPPRRQSSARDLIESGNAGTGFGKRFKVADAILRGAYRDQAGHHFCEQS